MNSWLPGILVLVIGLAVGLFVGLRSLRETAPKKPETANPQPVKEGTTGTEVSPSLPSARRLVLKGFAWGVLTTALVGLLLYWVSVSPPRPSDAADVVPASASTGRVPDLPAHQGDVELGEEVREELAALRARLAADSSDVGARKALAVRLLANDRMVEAFEQAEQILAVHPDDPDGLYVQGVVRLAMGQAGRSMDLLERVLAQYPDHVLALITLGRAQDRVGLTSEARRTWQRGLEAAGGRHAELEALLSGSGGGGPSAAPRAAEAPPAADRFTVQLSLTPGVTPPAGATLFVSVRTAEGVPPSAAHRIDRPRFPLRVSLGAEHSMMEQELPTEGRIEARLDQDGNAFSVDPGDLVAAAEGTLGQVISLRLGEQ